MVDFTDSGGNPITDLGNGEWSGVGQTWGNGSQEQALAYFNSILPAPPVSVPPVQTPTVPPSITNFQCRAILMQTPNPADSAQTLFQVVDAAIQAMGATTAAYQAWEYANEVTRSGSLVEQMAATLGVSSAEVDRLFIAASAISA